MFLARIFLFLTVAFTSIFHVDGNALQNIVAKIEREHLDRTGDNPKLRPFIDSFFRYRKSVNVIIDDSLDRKASWEFEFIHSLLQNIGKSMVVLELGSRNVISPTDPKWSKISVKSFIINTSDERFISYFLKRMKTHQIHWKHNAKFLAITRVKCTDKQPSHAIFEELWTHYSISGVLLVDSRGRCAVGYNPFKNATMTFRRSNLEKLYEFYERQYSNLAGHPLRVSLSPHLPFAIPIKNSSNVLGSEGLILDSLVKYMNCTKIVSAPPDEKGHGRVIDNGTVTGALGQIFRGETDISLNRRFLTRKGTDIYDFSAPVFISSLNFIVVSNNRIPTWMNMYRVFDIEVLMTCLLVFFSSLIVLSLSLKYIQNLDIGEHIGSLSLDVYRQLLGGATNRRVVHLTERIIFFGLLFCALIITNSFQGHLITMYSTISRTAQIDSLEELDKSGLEITTTSEEYGDIILDTDNAAVQSLAKKIVPQDFDSLYESMTSKIPRNSALLTTDAIAKFYYVLNAITYKAKSSAYVIKESLTAGPIGYIVSKDSPFLKTVNSVTRHLTEAGLLKKWMEESYRNASIYLHRNRTAESEPFPKPFGLKDLRVPFIILICGITISFITFIIEILWHKFTLYKRRARRQRLALKLLRPLEVAERNERYFRIVARARRGRARVHAESRF